MPDELESLPDAAAISPRWGSYRGIGDKSTDNYPLLIADDREIGKCNRKTGVSDRFTALSSSRDC